MTQPHRRMRVSHPICEDGKVYTRRVTDMTSDERAAVVTAANAEVATRNRAERDKRLAACDWVVTKALEAGGSCAYLHWVTDTVQHCVILQDTLTGLT